jgi:tetratricopeptide (TPR) repeat protein
MTSTCVAQLAVRGGKLCNLSGGQGIEEGGGNDMGEKIKWHTIPKNERVRDHKNDWIFILLHDEVYERLGVPKLPVPLSPEDMKETLNDGNMSFGLMLHNMLGFVGDEPGKEEEYSPFIAKIAYILGVDMGRVGQHISAKEHFLIAKIFCPNDITIRGNLASSYIYLGEYEEAIIELEEAMRLIGEHGVSPEIWVRAAQAYNCIGKEGEGKRILEDMVRRFLTLDPEDSERMKRVALEYCSARRDKTILEMLIDVLSGNAVRHSH